jgi:dTDP-4-dehydrorhamnose reductase
MNFLVTGSGGQLARAFQKTLSAQGLKFEAPPEEDLDITNFQQVENTVKRIMPDVILNCAAYNSVDMAEENPSVAFNVNHHAVRNLSSLCKKMDIFLVHYSTDYVFDGEKGDFYREEDKTNPLNKYGESKLKGEEAVRENQDNSLILRLSWVFGKGGSNFLCKLAKWAEEKRILKISADEVSIPTYTEDIVEVTLAALERGMKGLYHLTNSGYCSRYELAKHFIKKMGMNNVLIPVPVSAFQTPAKRPSFSAMANGRISKELNVTIPEWEDGINRFIKKFGNV